MILSTEKYIPSSLRPVISEPKPWLKKETWGIGIPDGGDGVGMTHGPFFTEIEALECIGKNGSIIIHFPTGRMTKDIWYWKDDGWIKIK